MSNKYHIACIQFDWTYKSVFVFYFTCKQQQQSFFHFIQNEIGYSGDKKSWIGIDSKYAINFENLQLQFARYVLAFARCQLKTASYQHAWEITSYDEKQMNKKELITIIQNESRSEKRLLWSFELNVSVECICSVLPYLHWNFQSSTSTSAVSLAPDSLSICVCWNYSKCCVWFDLN